MYPLQVAAAVIGGLLAVNVLFAGILVFFERRNPASTWAWLLVLFFIPGLGFLIYFVFGRDARQEKVFWEKQREDERAFQSFLKKKNYKNRIEQQKASAKTESSLTGFPYLDDLAYLNLNVGSVMTENNQVACYFDGERKFHALIEDIRQAERFIHMEYYILRGDTLGRHIVEELTKKAKQGVEVKFLYDAMGCYFLPRHFFRELEQAGGQTAAFMPPTMVRLNYRDHRKLCMIDGKVGYVGGFNIGDEYLGRVKKYGNWRDTHLRIAGDALDYMEFRFLTDWNFASENKTEFSDDYFPNRIQGTGVKIQIASSGPDTKWHTIRNGYFKMINEAEKSVYLETPYFVPDDSVLNALKVAALSGIDVRIIIPGNPDHFFVYWASLSYLWELIRVGAKCYRYENGFIHAKTLCIDGKVASVGTANMDVRSFMYNCEINAFLFDTAVTEELEQAFLKDILQSTEITWESYGQRSFFVKMKEAVSRLISPIL